jgi:hypothetical protein
MALVWHDDFNWTIPVNHPSNFVKILVVLKLTNIEVIVLTIKHHKTKTIFIFEYGKREPFLKL